MMRWGGGLCPRQGTPASPGRPCFIPMRRGRSSHLFHGPAMGDLIVLLAPFLIGFVFGYGVRAWVSRRRGVVIANRQETGQ
jgi:hypothetical protein